VLARVFLYGFVTGSLVSGVLFPLMYMAGLREIGHAGDLVVVLAMILWPTSPLLMAVQSPGITFFGMTVLAVAVLSNGLLYSLVAVAGWLLLRRLGVF
jgi:hypothetical protein